MRGVALALAAACALCAGAGYAGTQARPVEPDAGTLCRPASTLDLFTAGAVRGAIR